MSASSRSGRLTLSYAHNRSPGVFAHSERSAGEEGGQGGVARMKREESERVEDEDCVLVWGCFCFLCQYQSTTHSLQQIWSFRMVQLGLNGVILFLTTKIANKIYYVVSSASAATSKMRRFMIETGFDTHDLLHANPLNPYFVSQYSQIHSMRTRKTVLIQNALKREMFVPDLLAPDST